MWRDLWRTPQSVMWEQAGSHRVVARYCVLLVDAEKPDVKVTLLGEVRQLEDRLGLSPMSMRRLEWEIDDIEPSAPQSKSKGNVTRIDEYRDLYGSD